MSQYAGILIPVLLIIDILFLYGFTRYVNNLESRRNRMLVPVAGAVFYVFIISGFVCLLDEGIIGGIIFIVIPTLAILTVLPVAESFQKIKNRGVLIAIISVPLTIGLLVYLWAWNFSGIPTVILAMEAVIHPSSPFFLPVGLLFWYCQLLIICGALAGAFALARSYGQDDVSGSGSPDTSGQVAPIVLLGIGSVFINSLVVGFLAIFLHLVLREVPVRAVRVAVPVAGALLIAYVASGMVPQEPISFSLPVLLFVALGIVTLFPCFERYLLPKELPGIYLCSTATVIVLAVLFHDPAANPFEILARGLSAIIDSGLFAVGTSFAEGMVKKTVLFVSAIVVSGIMYAALALTMRWIRKKKGGDSSVRPVPEESPDHTGGNGQPEHSGHAGRTGETKPERPDREVGTG